MSHYATKLEIYADTGLDLDVNKATNQAGLYQYFASKRIASMDSMSVIRGTTGTVEVQMRMADLERADYLSFVNENLSFKRYYCKIVNVEYINDNNTRITYVVDYVKTFIYSANFHSGGIRREHLSEADWQKAIANPWRKDILELTTAESYAIPEEGYTVSGRGNAEFESEGTSFLPRDLASKTGSGGDLVLAMRISPFEQPDPIVETNKKEAAEAVKALNDKYGIKTDKQIRQASNWVNTRDDVAFWQLAGSVVKAALGNSTDLVIHQRSRAYVQEFNEIRKKYGITGDDFTQASKWEIFKSKCPAMMSPYIINGVSCPFYTLIFPANQSGIESLSDVTDWLAANGFTSSIIDIVSVPIALLDETSTPNKELDLYVSNRSRHPKLCRSPFTFIRITDPNGNKKEFQFENFSNVFNGHSKYAKFKFIRSLDGVPLMGVSPISYKTVMGSGEGAGNTTDISLNVHESMIYDSFPKMPYSTDSWLQYVSTLQASHAHSSTAPAMTQGAANLLGGMLSTALSLGTGAAAMTQGGQAAGMGAANMANNALGNAGMLAQMQGWGANEKIKQSLNKGDTEVLKSYQGPTDLWNSVKPLYAMDQYHPGSDRGFLPYHLYGMNFKIEVITLDPRYKEEVEKYLDLYGYSSTRIGVPYIVQQIQGWGEAPHYESVDGKLTTFVQTENCIVSDVPQPAKQQIERIFNTGVRFVK